MDNKRIDLIGPRTGKNILKDKIIRKDKYGVDVFEDYWSDTEAEDTLSTSTKSSLSSKVPKVCSSSVTNGEQHKEILPFEDVTLASGSRKRKTSSPLKMASVSESPKKKTSPLLKVASVSESPKKNTSPPLKVTSEVHRSNSRKSVVLKTKNAAIMEEILPHYDELDLEIMQMFNEKESNSPKKGLRKSTRILGKQFYKARKMANTSLGEDRDEYDLALLGQKLNTSSSDVSPSRFSNINQTANLEESKGSETNKYSDLEENSQHDSHTKRKSTMLSNEDTFLNCKTSPRKTNYTLRNNTSERETIGPDVEKSLIYSKKQSKSKSISHLMFENSNQDMQNDDPVMIENSLEEEITDFEDKNISKNLLRVSPRKKNELNFSTTSTTGSFEHKKIDVTEIKKNKYTFAKESGKLGEKNRYRQKFVSSHFLNKQTKSSTASSIKFLENSISEEGSELSKEAQQSFHDLPANVSSKSTPCSKRNDSHVSSQHHKSFTAEKKSLRNSSLKRKLNSPYLFRSRRNCSTNGENNLDEEPTINRKNVTKRLNLTFSPNKESPLKSNKRKSNSYAAPINPIVVEDNNSEARIDDANSMQTNDCSNEKISDAVSDDEVGIDSPKCTEDINVTYNHQNSPKLLENQSIVGNKSSKKVNQPNELIPRQTIIDECDLSVQKQKKKKKKKKNQISKIVTNNTEPIRKSTRQRFPPLAGWRNQRFIYSHDENGLLTIKGVEEGKEDDAAIQQLLKIQIRRQVQREKKSGKPKRAKLVDTVAKKKGNCELGESFLSYSLVII